MTYAELLLLFVVAPVLILGVALSARWRRRHRTAAGQSANLPRRSISVSLLALVVLATLYTMPWDNHLIATGVWWYRPALVSGVSIGSMPIEEVSFFPLQTLLVGLWWIALTAWVARPLARVTVHGGSSGRVRLSGFSIRAAVCATGVLLWLGALLLLRVGWHQGTYLGWEFAWALPPLLLQILVGGDVLWRQWRLIGACVVSVALYLSGVDALAIHTRIWTIDPHQSLDILLGGQLPLEELIFFLITSSLVICGLTLGVAPEVRQRLRAVPAGITRWWGARSPSRGT